MNLHLKDRDGFHPVHLRFEWFTHLRTLWNATLSALRGFKVSTHAGARMVACTHPESAITNYESRTVCPLRFNSIDSKVIQS